MIPDKYNLTNGISGHSSEDQKWNVFRRQPKRRGPWNGATAWLPSFGTCDKYLALELSNTRLCICFDLSCGMRQNPATHSELCGFYATHSPTMREVRSLLGGGGIVKYSYYKTLCINNYCRVVFGVLLNVFLFVIIIKYNYIIQLLIYYTMFGRKTFIHYPIAT